MEVKARPRYIISERTWETNEKGGGKEMFKIERKIVEFVERNVNILFMLAITGLAIVVRYAGRDFVSGDMTWFLLGWFTKNSG